MNRSDDKGREARFRFSDYRYTFLGLSVVFLFVVMPLLEREEQPFVPFLFLLVMAVVLWTLSLPKAFFGLCVVLGLLGFGFSLWMELRAVSEAVSQVGELALLGVYTSFYGICLVVFLHRIFSEKMNHGRYHSGGNCRLFSQRAVVGVFLSHLALARPHCDFIAGSYIGRVFRVDLFFLCHADHFGVRRDNAGELDGAKPDPVGSRLGSDVSGGAGCSPGGIAFEWGR